VKDYYYRLFQNLTRERAPVALLEQIKLEIDKLERRVILVRRFSFLSVATIFASACVPVYNYLAVEFATSSFSSYASLIVSDGDIALLNSKEFILSLIESLPLTSITLVLTLVFLLLGAINLIGTKSREVTELITTRFA
jgi:hypothetical protein